MAKQLFEILFVLFTWIYFFGEGVTEGMSTKDNPHFETKKEQDRYHAYRCIEQGGIIMAIHLVFIFAKLFYMIPIFWLTAAAGLGLYEMSFSWAKYGNPLFNKNSKWFFIPHPPGWCSLLALILFGSIIIIVIV